MITLIAVILVYVVGAVISFGLTLNMCIKFLPTIPNDWWPEEFITCLVLSVIWPVSLPSCFMVYDRTARTNEKIKHGLMFWPPNFLDRLKLIKRLSEI